MIKATLMARICILSILSGMITIIIIIAISRYIALESRKYAGALPPCIYLLNTDLSFAVEDCQFIGKRVLDNRIVVLLEIGHLQAAGTPLVPTDYILTCVVFINKASFAVSSDAHSTGTLRDSCGRRKL